MIKSNTTNYKYILLEKTHITTSDSVKWKYNSEIMF